MVCMLVDLVAAELDWVQKHIAGRFARAEPRSRVREYVSGLALEPAKLVPRSYRRGKCRRAFLWGWPHVTFGPTPGPCGGRIIGSTVPTVSVTTLRVIERMERPAGR